MRCETGGTRTPGVLLKQIAQRSKLEPLRGFWLTIALGDRDPPIRRSSANRLGFVCSGSSRCAIDVAIITITLNRFTPRFTNNLLKRSGGLLLGSGGARHVENFFLHDGAVQI